MPEATPAAGDPGQSRAERERQQRREKRQERYEEVLRLHQEGYSDRAIAKLTGKCRHTVRKYLKTDGFPEISRRQRGPTTLTPYHSYLERRWQEGCHNATQLWRELQEQGYRGARSTVADFIARWRKRLPPELRRTSGPKARDGGRPEVPSPRTVTWWLVHPEVKLEADQITFRDRLLELRPELKVAQPLVREFFRLARDREGHRLEAWVAAAEQSDIAELQRFAAGLRKDWEAVVAGLTLEWSNGQVEGQVNRLKLIKRQMYGRASFGLLRARVLQPG